jgi:senataxin
MRAYSFLHQWLFLLCLFSRYYDQVAASIEHSMLTHSKYSNKENNGKPRLLVAAPSNVAVDNIIIKIIQDGFVDGKGVRYNPRIVRVGNGLGDSVKSVSLETLVEAISSDEARLLTEITQLRRQEHSMQQEYETWKSKLSYLVRSTPTDGLPLHWEVRIDQTTGAAVYVDHQQKCVQMTPPEISNLSSLPRHGAKEQPEYQSMLQRLVMLRESLEQVELEAKQREFAQRWLAENRTSNALTNRDMSGGRRRLAMELEASILNEAHIVFTTLNSAGHESLNTTDSFNVVIVDEAAQATEAAILVPLVFCGSKPMRNVVLVGDPQQLRATAFSVSSSSQAASSETNILTMTDRADEILQRSLFERLEMSGHSVHLLNLQYRMHPSISVFPRNVFYDGLLKDSPSVLSLKEGFHRLFPPFMFLNVTAQRQASSHGQRSNEAEAEAVFQVYAALKTAATGDSPLPGRVGILTPYREQLRLLRRIAGLITYLQKYV